jgi:hypothetical protein
MPSQKQRVALMRAYKSVCRYCNKLIESLAELEIDHIIPESLDKDDLKNLLKRLSKEDLDINSYFNWFPVHRSCNNPKSDTVLPDASLHYLLGIAADKEPAVRAEEAKFEQQARGNDALGKLAHQIELGVLSKGAAIAFLQGTPTNPAYKNDPVILGFSINLADAVGTGSEFHLPGDMLLNLDDDELTGSGPNLASLQAQLEDSLKVLNALIAKAEYQNNGETLSIRYAVWLLNLDLLPKKLPNAWRLLEVSPFSEVYPGQDASILEDQAVILRRNELIIDRNSDHPLPYRYCPMCASRKLYRGSRSTQEEWIYYVTCSDCGWAEAETL